MTISKITNPPSQKGVIDKINEIIDSIGGSGGSVTSVNGQTGDVMLTASDIGITEYTANEVETLWNSITPS